MAWKIDHRKRRSFTDQQCLTMALANFQIDRGPSWFALPTLPSPIPTERSSMPGDDRFGLHEEQRPSAIATKSGKAKPRAGGRWG